eukprot:m.130990 g.130990  ORF g.130990 m.130990 type:complete len:67 (-) comp13740_c0_seq1:231-431(-)
MAPLFLGALWVVSAGSLPKPAELTGKVTSPSSALLKWTPAVGNVSARYEIYRKLVSSHLSRATPAG